MKFVIHLEFWQLSQSGNGVTF